jgi:hypothetical protein
MNNDLHNNLHPRRAISPVSVADNTAQVSQIIDMQGYGSMEFYIVIGSIADADATFAVLVEESDVSDLSGGNAVADADLLGTELLAGFAFSDDDKVRKIGYVGNKRYVRLTITPAGNASAAVLAAIAVMGSPSVLPTANPPA